MLLLARRWYWELVLLLQRAALSIANTFFHLTTVRIVVQLVICVTCLSIHVAAQPFKTLELNRFQAFLQLTLCLVTVCSVQVGVLDTRACSTSTKGPTEDVATWYSNIIAVLGILPSLGLFAIAARAEHTKLFGMVCSFLNICRLGSDAEEENRDVLSIPGSNFGSHDSSGSYRSGNSGTDFGSHSSHRS